MSLRDRVLDEALATAKAWSHEAVEPRHVLAAIVCVLGAKAPDGLTTESVRTWLAPVGTAAVTPSVTDVAQAAIDRCSTEEAASREARDILAWLRGTGPVGGTASAAATADPKTAGAGERTSSADRELSPAAAAVVGTATIAELLAELDGLVGLDSVKKEIRKLVAVQRLNAERRAQGLPEVTGSAHLVFTGDPGTGKTTVARIVGRLYGALGLVSKGHLVEATRADLVAGYVGQTALKVQEVVRSAIGGVLFIDEAYALSTGDSQDFGGEAVATVVKMMEDHRGDLAVIVAGYKEPMWDFIRSNPGLRSRFTRYIEFPNYSTAELAEIFATMAAQAKVRTDEAVLARVLEVLASAGGIQDFGNARFVRTLFEQAYANMAARAVADDRIEAGELELMVPADIPDAGTPTGGASRRIGFGVRGRSS